MWALVSSYNGIALAEVPREPEREYVDVRKNKAGAWFEAYDRDPQLERRLFRDLIILRKFHLTVFSKIPITN